MSDIIISHDDQYETGDICPHSGRWTCSIHISPTIEKFVKEGDLFPPCDHVGKHSAIWHQVVPKTE